MNGLPIRTSEVTKINESLLVGQRGPLSLLVGQRGPLSLLVGQRGPPFPFILYA